MFRVSIRILLLALVMSLGLGACGDGQHDGPAVPHEVSSTKNANCRSCHLAGTNGAPKSPHPYRLDCVGCHAVKASQIVPAPDVPHTVTDTQRDTCLACRLNRESLAPQTKHPNRDDCTVCHAVTASQITPAPAVPHQVGSLYDSTCLVCHRAGDNGAPKMPHRNRDTCVGCHLVNASQTEWAPSVPHNVTDTHDATCLSCHETGVGEADRTPHPDRKACAGCHAVRASQIVPASPLMP